MTIKVCGMREAENIRAVEALGVDMMGFIFYPRSPRFAGAEPPEYLPSCSRVGVFVNETEERILQCCAAWGLDSVQLHGSESPQLCASLKARGFRVIKAFSVSDGSELQATADYEGCCGLFVFDTRCSGVGGSGVSFDWSLLKAYGGGTPFLLSGGLGPDSALEGFSHPKLAGYDLNSRFETEPGIKDAAMLKTFIDKIKNNTHE